MPNPNPWNTDEEPSAWERDRLEWERFFSDFQAESRSLGWIAWVGPFAALGAVGLLWLTSL